MVDVASEAEFEPELADVGRARVLADTQQVQDLGGVAAVIEVQVSEVRPTLPTRQPILLSFLHSLFEVAVGDMSRVPLCLLVKEVARVGPL